MMTFIYLFVVIDGKQLCFDGLDVSDGSFQYYWLGDIDDHV